MVSIVVNGRSDFLFKVFHSVRWQRYLKLQIWNQCFSCWQLSSFCNWCDSFISPLLQTISMLLHLSSKSKKKDFQVYFLVDINIFQTRYGGNDRLYRFKALTTSCFGWYKTKSCQCDFINIPNNCFNRTTDHLKSFSKGLLKRDSPYHRVRRTWMKDEGRHVLIPWSQNYFSCFENKGEDF